MSKDCIELFTDANAGTVATLRERALIESIRAWLGAVAPATPEGMGDDTAVLAPPPGKLLITLDPVIYGRHFDESARPEAVGAKLLKRNLSDIAAMGGRPDYAVLGLVMPGNVSLAWLEGFVQGLRECAENFAVKVVGGDVAEGPPDSFIAQLTLTGHAERPVPRQGGGVGDSLWVTGSLGGSLMGHHLSFTPRIQEGQWLARQGGIKGMIDITDGLFVDLAKLLPPDSVAMLDCKQVPISEAANKVAAQSGHSPLAHALGDGEDYELAFVMDNKVDADAFLGQWQAFTDTPLSRIGCISAKSQSSASQLIDSQSGEPIDAPGGYEHFQQSPPQA